VDTRVTLLVASLLAATACEGNGPTEPARAASAVTAARTDSGAAFSRPSPRILSPRGSGAPLATGTWGGDQAELVVTTSGASTRLFCAHGAIEQPILLDSSGRFEAGGYSVFEGGPTPIDDTPFRRPAIYSGSSDGKTMTLTVTLPTQNQKLGPFTLVFGQGTTLRPCPIV
jgi:hypothetical protein